MSLSRSVSEKESDFSRKSQNFPPHVICAPAEGVPFEFSTGATVQKTRMMGLPGRERSLMSRLDTIHLRDRETDGRADRQTPDDSKDRVYALRRAVKTLLQSIILHKI